MKFFLNIGFLYMLCFLAFSCKKMTEKEAVDFSLDFIKDNDYVINNLKKKLQVVDYVDKDIILTTKPGSGVLDCSCNNCLGTLLDNQKKDIAYYIDDDPVTYIKFNKSAYIEFGFTYRNDFLRNYCIREYLDIKDSSKYTKPYLKQYFLKDNWVVCSYQKER